MFLKGAFGLALGQMAYQVMGRQRRPAVQIGLPQGNVF